MLAGDLLGAIAANPRGGGRNPNVAKRAQISADAGDAPAEYVPRGPRRDAYDSRAAAAATEHRRNSRKPPPTQLRERVQSSAYS